MQPKAFNPKTPFAVVNSMDPDAAAYIAELQAQGYNPSEAVETAIDTYFRYLKGEVEGGFDIYANVVANYPLIGLTAAPQAINASDPGGSYTMTFNGGGTYTANGWTGNGVNAYGQTGLLASDLTSNNKTYLVYVRDNYDGADTPFGAVNAAFVGDVMYPKLANRLYGSIESAVGGGVANAVSSAGLWVITRAAAGDLRIYKNGVIFWTPNFAQNTNLALELFMGARNFNGSPDRYARYNICHFTCIDQGLTLDDVQSLSQATNDLATALGRNIY